MGKIMLLFVAFLSLFFSGSAGESAVKRAEKYEPIFQETVKRAIAQKNPNICNELKKDVHYATDWGCDNCFERWYQNDCLSKYIAEYPDIKTCQLFDDSITGPPEYRSGMSYGYSKPNWELYTKTSCIKKFSKELSAVEACDWLNTLDEKLLCKAEVTGDIALCWNKNIAHPKDCVTSITSSTPKIEICNSLLTLKDHESYDEMVAYCESSDKNFEKSVIYENALNDARKEINVMNGKTFEERIAISLRVDEYPSFPRPFRRCYEENANKSGNPSQYVANCIIETAETKEDCYNYLPSRNNAFDLGRCLDFVALKTKDVSVCREFSAVGERQNCVQNLAEYTKNIDICEEVSERPLDIETCKAKIQDNVEPCLSLENTEEQYICANAAAEFNINTELCKIIPFEDSRRILGLFLGQNSCKQNATWQFANKPPKNKGYCWSYDCSKL